jgi:hypothetical protein
MKAGAAGVSLEAIRGSLVPARANARTVAALTDNPGCTRRRVIDAARVPAFDLAARLGHPVTRGQSPFAITTGNRFEKRLKEGSDYKLLVEVLRPFVDLPEAGLRVEDLGHARGHRVGPGWLEARAKKTDDVIAAIARGDASAPHIVDHPVLVFEVAGTPVYLEPDALAFRIGKQLQLVEIKSYAVIDGQAPPSKVSATGSQAAVYILALRAALARLGFDPDILRWSVILVAPKNFGRTPVAHEVPLRKKASALSRVLRNVPRTDDLLAKLPADFTLDVDPKERMPEAGRQRALDGAVRKLAMRYVPECLAACDMARFCRAQSIADDDPARLGRSARDMLAGVPTLADARRLATQGPRAGEESLTDVANALKTAQRALERARDRAPAACGLSPKGRGRSSS